MTVDATAQDSKFRSRIFRFQLEVNETLGSIIVASRHSSSTMMSTRIIAVLLLVTYSLAFQGPVFKASSHSTHLWAKKTSGSGGKGFGKQAPPPPTKPQEASVAEQTVAGLSSVEKGGSDVIPTVEVPPPVVAQAAAPAEPEVPVEERTRRILQEQYGLRTLEDQQRQDKLMEQRRKFEELKERAEKDENFDIMQVLPEPVLIGIDRFLKVGVTISTVLFVAAGLGITTEAWSAATKNPLPPDIQQFIVNTVEPNFTTGLLVLLGFSVSLGLFSAAQLGSSGSQYRGDRRT
jgi:hypothetical protein